MGKLKGIELQVALSNPPKKEENPPAGAASKEQIRSLGGTSQDPGPRGKGRSQLAFTPRVLATSSTAKGQAAAKLQPMKFVKPGAGVKEKEGAMARRRKGESQQRRGTEIKCRLPEHVPQIILIITHPKLNCYSFYLVLF